MQEKVYVVGAGIIGVCCALALQRDGRQVVLLDKTGPGSGASFGNAGAVVNGSCVPTATPGIAFSALKMLLNGPLSISPKHLLSTLPWLIRFLNQSREHHYSHNAKHLVALTEHATDSWHKLLDNTDCAEMFKAVGWLRLFESTASFNANASAREMMTRCGTDFEILDAQQVQELEPQLAPIFKHGCLQKDCHFISNPERMLAGLVEHFLQNGGELKIADVQDICLADQKISIRTTTETLTPAKLVLTAGAWSTRLSKGVNYSAPLIAERGYHLMLPATSAISRPIVNADQGFVISPMETGLRLTSQVELTDVDAAPNYAKIRSLLPLVERMLPGQQLSEQSVWVGARPSLPDSLPIISRHTHPDLLFAFGHQHLGMTLGPITGELIADLVAQRTPKIDLHAYRASRF